MTMLVIDYVDGSEYGLFRVNDDHEILETLEYGDLRSLLDVMSDYYGSTGKVYVSEMVNMLINGVPPMANKNEEVAAEVIKKIIEGILDELEDHDDEGEYHETT